MTSLLLLDDHPLVRLGIRHLIAAERPAWQIVAEVTNGHEAVGVLGRARPDVAVLDLSLPDLSGLQLLRQVSHLSPGTRTVVLSVHDGPGYAAAARDAGARAFVSKADVATSLISTIETVLAGGSTITARSDETPERDPLAGLTPREREVLLLSLDGATARDVADRLGISFRTVEVHRSAIYEKLGLAGISELIAYAHRCRLVVDT